MKLTAKSSNTGKLMFNDLGKVIKGVAPDALPQAIALDPGESIYLPNSSGVLFSAMQGDARRYEDAGLLDINDIEALTPSDTIVANHNFKFVPMVQVMKKSGSDWVPAVIGTDVDVKTDATLSTTTVTCLIAGDYYVNIG